MVVHDKNSDKSNEEVDGKLSQIQDQLQKLMEGVSSIYERNVQADKELLGLKETLGSLMSKEKKRSREELNFPPSEVVQLGCKIIKVTIRISMELEIMVMDNFLLDSPNWSSFIFLVVNYALGYTKLIKSFL